MSYNLNSEEDVNAYIKNLGTEYKFGCFSEKNSEVCHLLGDYLEAISKDFKKAGRVYMTNCNDYNFAKSCYKTANYFLLGKGGFETSQDKALEYYEKGCKLEDNESCFRSGVLSILKNKSKGIEYLKKSCEGQHADACHHISAIYLEGSDSTGIVKDMSKAFEYAVKSCHLGNDHACVNVSIMYKRGEGVEKNQEQSEKYKQLAFEKKKELEKQNQIIFQEGLKPI